MRLSCRSCGQLQGQRMKKMQEHLKTVRPTDLNNSRPINLFRVATEPVLERSLDELARAAFEHTGQRNAPGANAWEKFSKCVHAIALDLYAAHKHDPSLHVGYSRTASKLSGTDRYNPHFLSKDQFLKAVDGLTAAGYLQQTFKGIEASGMSSRMQGTALLVELLDASARSQFDINVVQGNETIFMSEKEKRGDRVIKRRLPYEDTDDTRRWRLNVETINQVLRRHWYDLEDQTGQGELMDDGSTLQIDWADPRLAVVDLHRRQLYRTFNNGSFGLGGRFYGGWWQEIPSEYRRFITIDGKPTCELDFRSIHPSILYARAGLPLDTDPYQAAFDGQFREIVKPTFNALLNAKGIPDPIDEFDPEAIGMTWDKFVDRVVDSLGPLKQHMLKGVGLSLQNVDAQIAEEVMLHFAKMDVPCLSVHDSFIVMSHYRDELETTMVRAFEKVVGVAPATKTSHHVLISDPRHQRHSVTTFLDAGDIELELTPARRRLAEFWEYVHQESNLVDAR